MCIRDSKNTWLQATFAKPTSLSYFKIVFETRDAGAPPTPSNVKAFDIEYKLSLIHI